MIWWCLKHEASSAGSTDECMYEGEWGAGRLANCDIREALLVVKENGEWPAWAMACATQGWYAPTPSKQALIVLDALASVGET